MAIKRMYRYLEIINLMIYALDLVVYIMFIFFYLYIYLLVKLLYNRFKLQYILWKNRIPYTIRREILELYDEKIDKLLDPRNILRFLTWKPYSNI